MYVVGQIVDWSPNRLVDLLVNDMLACSCALSGVLSAGFDPMCCHPFLFSETCSARAMAMSPDHCRIMDEAGKFADNAWRADGAYIAGPFGYEAVHYSSVKMAHPSFPIFMYYLGMMPMTSNGASVDLWGSDDPVCVCVLNVNHSETRKSRFLVSCQCCVVYVVFICPIVCPRHVFVDLSRRHQCAMSPCRVGVLVRGVGTVRGGDTGK